MIKAIFWDNDGVLVDTERLYFRATQQVLETVGFTLTKDQYIEFYLVQGKGAWHLAEAEGVSPQTIEELRQKRNALYDAFLVQETTVLPGVRTVLDALHETYAMGIVTSSAPDHFEHMHQTTGLLPYFQFVLTTGDSTRTKPYPDPYLLAIERSGFPPDECLVIEDSERGLTAATAAGLRCMVVPTELTRGGNFAAAEKVLDNLTELVEALPPMSHKPN